MTVMLRFLASSYGTVCKLMWWLDWLVSAAKGTTECADALSFLSVPQEGQGISGHGGSCMEIPAVVPKFARTPDRLPPDPLNRLRSTDGPSNSPHPLVVVGQLCQAAWKPSSKDNL